MENQINKRRPSRRFTLAEQKQMYEQMLTAVKAGSSVVKATSDLGLATSSFYRYRDMFDPTNKAPSTYRTLRSTRGSRGRSLGSRNTIVKLPDNVSIDRSKLTTVTIPSNDRLIILVGNSSDVRLVLEKLNLNNL